MNFWMGVIFGSRPSATIEQHHPDELSRLLINHDWYRTNVAITHDSGHHLCTVAWHTTNWIWAHHFFDLHGYLLNGYLLPSASCLLPNFDLVYDLPVASERFHVAHCKVMLFFAIYRTCQHHRTLVRLNTDVGIGKRRF